MQASAVLGPVVTRTRRVVMIVFALSTISHAPAGAHSVAGAGSSNFHSAVEAVTPPQPGFAIRVIEATNRMEIRWKSGEEITVIGYEEEPYLRIGPKGVFENLESTATYLNRDRDGTTAPVPDNVDPANPPRWRKVSDQPVARWHEHRVHWMSPFSPDAVKAAPKRRHVISNWDVPLRVGGVDVRASGRLEWRPGQSMTPWLLLAAIVGVLVAGVGIVSRRTTAAVRKLPVLAALVVALVIVDAVHLYGIAAGVVDGSTLGRVFTTGYASVVAWLVGLVAASVLIRRRMGGLYPMVFAAGIMTVVGGFADLNTLTHSNLVFAFSPDLARVLVALTLGLGIGLVVTGLVLTGVSPEAAKGVTPGAHALPDSAADG